MVQNNRIQALIIAFAAAGILGGSYWLSQHDFGGPAPKAAATAGANAANAANLDDEVSGSAAAPGEADVSAADAEANTEAASGDL